MKITPIDIERHKFRSGLMGYDRKAVDEFLKDVAHAFELILEESQALREKADTLSDIKQDLEDTLVMAKRASEDIITNARREAEIIKSELSIEMRRVEEEILRAKYRRDMFYREFEIQLKVYLDEVAKLRAASEAAEAAAEPPPKKRRPAAKPVPAEPPPARPDEPILPEVPPADGDAPKS